MQPQSESHPENQLDLKNASGKEILKYLKISEDVHQRVQLVLQYVTACNECLVAAKESGNPPQCSSFCKDCMKYNRVCSEHGNLYTESLCGTLQCEPCLRRGDKCVRFSVLLSISDQASCYQKYDRSVSSSLSDTLDDQGKLIYPMKHIHDVAQASLKSGTHFDGHFTYDSKDLWMAACTSNKQQHNIIFQGLSECTLSQLDKQSEELASQRVSDPLISKSIFCFVKTDIPEL